MEDPAVLELMDSIVSTAENNILFHECTLLQRLPFSVIYHSIYYVCTKTVNDLANVTLSACGIDEERYPYWTTNWAFDPLYVSGFLNSSFISQLFDGKCLSGSQKISYVNTGEDTFCDRAAPEQLWTGLRPPAKASELFKGELINQGLCLTAVPIGGNTTVTTGNIVRLEACSSKATTSGTGTNPLQDWSVVKGNNAKTAISSVGSAIMTIASTPSEKIFGTFESSVFTLFGVSIALSYTLSSALHSICDSKLGLGEHRTGKLDHKVLND